jgi:hypothetical protein
MIVEAAAFARISVAASPAVSALCKYAEAEATAILTGNRDIVEALVEAGEKVDSIIGDCIAARAVEAERRRRFDWRTRQANATAFLKTIGSTGGE